MPPTKGGNSLVVDNERIDGMGIEDRISAMQCLDGYSTHVKHGFLMAQIEARLIAAEADELMREMESVIDGLLGMCALKHCDEAMKSDECHSACEILERYNNWKEKNQ